MQSSRRRFACLLVFAALILGSSRSGKLTETLDTTRKAVTTLAAANGGTIPPTTNLAADLQARELIARDMLVPEDMIADVHVMEISRLDSTRFAIMVRCLDSKGQVCGYVVQSLQGNPPLHHGILCGCPLGPAAAPVSEFKVTYDINSDDDPTVEVLTKPH